MKKLFIFLLILTSFKVFSQKIFSIKECVEYSIQNNIQIKQSTLNSELNANSLNQNKNNRYPNLSGNASYGYNWGKAVDAFTNELNTERVMSQNFSLSSSVILFNGLKLVNNIKKSNYDLLTTKEETEKLKYELTLSVASAYLQILYNEENKNISIKNLENIKQKKEKISKQIEVGKLPKNEIFTIDAEIANAELELINAESNIELAYLNLKILMNYNETENFVIQKVNINIPIDNIKTTTDAIYEISISNHPAIKAGESKLNSTITAIEIAKSEYYPSLSLRGSVGTGYSSASKIVENAYYSGENLIGYTESKENVYSPNYNYDYKTKSYTKQLDNNINTSLGFYLSIPIFDGFKVKSNVERYKIDKKNAELSLLNSKDNIKKEILQAYTDMTVARKKLDASLKSYNASKESYNVINQTKMELLGFMNLMMPILNL